MADFLLELRCEEIPARMQDRAGADLARLFAEETGKAGLAAQAVQVWATPRRLALIARGLPEATQAVSEERRGPRADAPEAAIAGFVKSTGLVREALEERETAKGRFLYAVVAAPGRATRDVLAEAIPAIVRGFPWPKSMRWGPASIDSASPRWVRPLSGIVALLGDGVVACEVAGIVADAATVGHRFHHPGIVTIGGADDYAAKLRACHVVLDPEERRAIIREGAATLAAAAGLAVVPDEGLVAENAGLTEWPVPLLGRFDPSFLSVPREVIQLSMRTNQKYFALTVGQDGPLAPAFVCVANIDARDGGAGVVAGNEKVLAARLSDARFFWEQDLRVPLAEQAAKLGGIVFHEKLGTVADKVARVAKLARWLVEEGVVAAAPSPIRGEGRGEGPSSSRGPVPHEIDRPLSQPSPRMGEGLAELAEQAARLCKADLVTGMVGEFPELQGVVGGHLARAQGLPDEVADAIRDHYKPVGQGDEVPTAPVTVAVSLADKLDTISGFFLVEERPTGSKDPFALRRAAIGVVELVLRNQLKFGTMHLFAQAMGHYHGHVVREARRHGSDGEDEIAEHYAAETYALVTSFVIDRLKVQQREAGVRHDLIDAMFALGGEDDLVRLLARVKALQGFVATADGANLLAGYKRAANILRKEGFTPAPSPIRGEGWGEETSAPSANAAPDEIDRPLAQPSPRMGEGFAPSELALLASLDEAEPLAAAAVAAEDFEGAMAALARLRAPIDAFFGSVIVNDADPATRLRRLALLARVRDAVHRVADFSKIEG